MTTRLVILENAYALMQGQQGQWAELAVLTGGAGALLAPGRGVDERGLERAIETAEDWLMPHAARLRGEVLEVDDATGRLRSGLAEVLSASGTEWSVGDWEELFLQLVDLATGRRPLPALQVRQSFIADVLVLRELAHHGQLDRMRLLSQAA